MMTQIILLNSTFCSLRLSKSLVVEGIFDVEARKSLRFRSSARALEGLSVAHISLVASYTFFFRSQTSEQV